MVTDEEIYEELRKKYVQKLQERLGGEESTPRTRQYEEFRQEYMPKPMSLYEKWCNQAAAVLPIDPDAKKKAVLEKAIAQCHLNIEPRGIVAFSVLAPLLFIFLSVFIFFGIPTILGMKSSLFVTAYVAIVGLIMIFPLQKIPEFMAVSWRMKSSNQMVLCIFYIVTYMRHTSNFELAVDFAAEHLTPPLSLDMKKIIWNLETEKYDSMQASMESYLEKWRHYNDEFIEAIHLIESSLVETTEGRRVEALEKSLSVMLEETYEKMLHYAHNLKGPLTTLHMLGIILPILGLVILPLMVAFIPSVRWYHIALLYDITLPVTVFFLGRDILSKRPTGYGSSDEKEMNKRRAPGFTFSLGKTVKTLTPMFVALFISLTLIFVGLIPLMVHTANDKFDMVFYDTPAHREEAADQGRLCLLGFCQVNTDIKDDLKGVNYYLLEYRLVKVPESTETFILGPFGLLATLLSLLIPLGVGLGAGFYHKLRTKNLMKIRQQAKQLELEFASALFQLGNRLADGLPLEIAFSKVAMVMPETPSGEFFSEVSANITKLGLSVDDAIFHEKYGAVHRYPSNIIESSMKVLVESAKKGPMIASQAIINVSNYIKEMHRVEERLKDLMADVISSMKSQISFLTPTIAGIVMGITSMITAILGKLGKQTDDLMASTGGAGAGVGGGLMDMFAGGGGVPTYFFQIVVGLYVVEIVYVLSILVNGIENGSDKVGEHATLGENVSRSTTTYTLLALVVIILFNIVAAKVVAGGG